MTFFYVCPTHLMFLFCIMSGTQCVAPNVLPHASHVPVMHHVRHPINASAAAPFTGNCLQAVGL
eukprot:1154951-Pelagomonas_calceolata.AAC.2